MRTAFAYTIGAVVLAGLAGGAARADEAYTIVSEHSTEIGGLTRTEWVVQAGDDPVNRFVMHRVHKSVANPAWKGSIILAPPAQAGVFANYEVMDNGVYTTSFVGYLADRGSFR